MKIGILGGTFNPIHRGHLKLAEAALADAGLDLIWIMPAGDPPHKDDITDTTRTERLELCRAAVGELSDSRIFVSDYELFKPTPSYTYQTMRELKTSYPDDDFYFIIGEDSFFKFTDWVHPEIIMEYSNLIVSARNANTKQEELKQTADELNKSYGKMPVILDVSPIEISSTRIREACRRGDYASIEEYLTPETLVYIKRHDLYKPTFDISYDELDKIRHDLKKRLKKYRYYHTLGVADTCAQLASRYGYPVLKAYTAGLLHDCAKYMSGDEYIKCAKKNKIAITESERQYPDLLHAKLGAYYAKKRYGIDDRDICHAICVHTTGEPGMNLLDEILYVSDYIEPSRTKQPRINDVRAMAYYDLRATVRMILSDTINYLRERSKVFDPTTYETAVSYGLDPDDGIKV